MTELLLDGQQRLTTIWRALTDNYPEHQYLVYFEADDSTGSNDLATVYGLRRWAPV